MIRSRNEFGECGMDAKTERENEGGDSHQQ